MIDTYNTWLYEIIGLQFETLQAVIGGEEKSDVILYFSFILLCGLEAKRPLGISKTVRFLNKSSYLIINLHTHMKEKCMDLQNAFQLIRILMSK